MSDWVSKEEMMRRLARSERSIQTYVREGKLERRIGADKRAYYREPPRDAVIRNDTQQSAAEPPPWAVELREAIARLDAKIDAQNAPQRALEASADRGEPQQPAAERGEPQRRSFWKRLFSPE